MVIPVDVVDRALVVEVATDECDACPAEAHVQAYVYAEFKTGSLAFCLHHGTMWWTELNKQADVVIDLRHFLTGDIP